MQPCYYIIDSQSNEQIPASIREATAADFERTAQEHWQTDWRTDLFRMLRFKNTLWIWMRPRSWSDLPLTGICRRACWFMWNI